MCPQFSLFGCLTGLYSECPVLFSDSKYWFSTFSRGNVENCPGIPELISHSDVLGEAELVPAFLCILSCFIFFGESTWEVWLMSKGQGVYQLGFFLRPIVCQFQDDCYHSFS